MMRKGKVLVTGTLAGLAIGAITGILVAPGKGSNTRRQIKDKSNDFLGVLNAKIYDFRHFLAKKFRSTKRDAENLAGNGKPKFHDVKKEVKNAASDFKHTVS